MTPALDVLDVLAARLGPSDRRHEDAGAVLELWLPGEGLAISRLHGRMSATLADALAAGVDVAIAQRPGEARAYHDWTAATGYAMGAQLRLTRWSVEVRNQMAQVMVAATAPSVVLAVRAARKATGKDLEVVESQAPWIARVSAALPA